MQGPGVEAKNAGGMMPLHWSRDGAGRDKRDDQR